MFTSLLSFNDLSSMDAFSTYCSSAVFCYLRRKIARDSLAILRDFIVNSRVFQLRVIGTIQTFVLSFALDLTVSAMLSFRYFAL